MYRRVGQMMTNSTDLILNQLMSSTSSVNNASVRDVLTEQEATGKQPQLAPSSSELADLLHNCLNPGSKQHNSLP